MRRTLLIFLALLLGSPVFGEIRNPGDVATQIFTIVDGRTGLPITGETPTAAVVRLTDGYYLDWDDDTFKASGWTEQYADMTEIGTTGRYIVDVDTAGYNYGDYAVLMATTGDNAAATTTSMILVSATSNLGSGQVPVNQDYPTPDNMTVQDEYGAGIENVYVRAYTKDDYDADRLGVSYIKGMTMTDANGEWDDYLFLTPATYTVVFIKAGLQTQTKEITVTEP